MPATTDPRLPPTVQPPCAPPARLGTVLLGHVGLTLIQATLFGNLIWLVPALVRLHFGAEDGNIRDWQTTLITAAMPTCMVFAIFWGDLLGRMRMRTYMGVYWLSTSLPLACIGLAQNYAQLLGCYVVAMLGQAGWMAMQGYLLKSFYKDSVRGRAYGLLNVAAHGGGFLFVYLVGKWIEMHPFAFRIYFPLAATFQLAGVVLLAWLVRVTHTADTLDAVPRRSWSALLRPVLNMRAALRSDATFLRYEAAFMTYGGAFMCCDALLPVLATDKLGMGYADYAHSTQMVVKLTMAVLILPAGWLLDRFGAVRTSGMSFGILGFYPILLLLAGDLFGVGVASTVFGAGLSGVTIGWMLGPVSLAPSPDKVLQYTAIHGTLVGIRGVLFQGLGMLIYKLTGGFAWPLGLAAFCFFWACWQMWRLHAALAAESLGARARSVSS